MIIVVVVIIITVIITIIIISINDSNIFVNITMYDHHRILHRTAQNKCS